MGLFDRIAERRLEEAIAAGAFEGLPGHGRPLELDDLDHVPEELRASYLLLKGAGYVPEEVLLRRERVRLSDLIAACSEGAERDELEMRCAALDLRIAMALEARLPAHATRALWARLRARRGRG